MTFAHWRLVVFAGWAGMVLSAGLIFAIDTPLAWVVIGSVAIIPIAIANRLWAVPEMTLSELIVRARSRS